MMRVVNDKSNGRGFKVLDEDGKEIEGLLIQSATIHVNVTDLNKVTLVCVLREGFEVEVLPDQCTVIYMGSKNDATKS